MDYKDSTSPSPSLYEEKMALQTQFYLISTSETEQLIMRSHGLYYEHGEKVEWLLARQLKLKSSLIISQIEDTTVVNTTDPQTINVLF